jgi:hypothetical protein
MTDTEKTVEEAWPKSASSAVMPFESWERLAGEGEKAFAAFCAFRDCGLERSIRKAVETVEKDSALQAKNTMCGGAGQRDTAGGNVRLTMTATLKN